jgi:hypothetical protein
MKQESPSFLKKEARNFYFWSCGKIGTMVSIVGAAQKKSLLVLFFRKERLS